jgi:hypothetical protein
MSNTDNTTKLEEQRITVNKRIKTLSKSRPAMSAFGDTNGFVLRYGQTRDIEPSLSAEISYDDALKANDTTLRKFINDSTPSKTRIISDIEIFTEKQKILVDLLHHGVDHQEWDEIARLNSKVRLISEELEGLRITLANIV